MPLVIGVTATPQRFQNLVIGIKTPVHPTFVVQVEDGNEREATQTDLGAYIDILEEVLGRKFQAGELVQTFDGRETIKVRSNGQVKFSATIFTENTGGRHAKRDYVMVKTEAIALANDNDVMERLERFADKLFNELYDENRSAFRRLREERKEVYENTYVPRLTCCPG